MQLDTDPSPSLQVPETQATGCELLTVLRSDDPAQSLFALAQYKDIPKYVRSKLTPLLQNKSTYYKGVAILHTLIRGMTQVSNKDKYRICAPNLIDAMSKISDTDRLDKIIGYVVKLSENVTNKDHYRVFFAHKLIDDMSKISDTDRLDKIIGYVVELSKDMKDKDHYRVFSAHKLIDNMSKISDTDRLDKIIGYVVKLSENVTNKDHYRVFFAHKLIDAMSKVGNTSKLDKIVRYVKELSKNVKDKDRYRQYAAHELIDAMSKVGNTSKLDKIVRYVKELSKNVKDKDRYRQYAAHELIDAMNQDLEKGYKIGTYIAEFANNVKDKDKYRENAAHKLIDNATHLYQDHIDLYFKLYEKHIQDTTKSKHLLLDIKGHTNDPKRNDLIGAIDTNLLIKILYKYDKSGAPSAIKYIHDLQTIGCDELLRDMGVIFGYIADDSQLHHSLMDDSIDPQLISQMPDTSKSKKSDTSRSRFQKDITSYKNVAHNYKLFDHRHPQLSQKFAKLQQKLIDTRWKLLDHKVAEYISGLYPGHIDKIQSLLSGPDNTTFVDMYIMTMKTEFNKTQAHKLMTQILSRQTYPDVQIENSAIYLAPANQAFLSKLNTEQQKAWTHPSPKTYQIDKTSGSADDKHIADISHHLSDAIKQFETIHAKQNTKLPESIQSIKSQLENKDEEKNMDNLKTMYVNINTVISKSYYTSLSQSSDTQLQSAYSDMIGQLHSINKIYSQTTTKNITSITITKEHNPLRISQMGNQVEGSCMASDREHFYSVFANICDINKAVYYITDQNQQVIGRFIMAIDDDLKLMRFHIYTVSGIPVDLTSYVDGYIKSIFHGIFDFGGQETKVSNLVCNTRYHDGVREIR